jgi:DNA-binding NarL/FixJ family response regulator
VKPHAGGVLVGHAHQRLSDGLRGWLQASFDGVYMVADRNSLVEGAQRLQPLLVVVDLALAEGDLGRLLAELHALAPASRTLLLSDYDDAHVDAAALAAGAAGVVHKSSLATDLSPAVEAVLAGRSFTSPPGAH